ncbi:ankyrin repeat domain-containing protein 16 [Tribolium castaneum]|uniref:Ankyrin repeat and KH domain-containing protein mask-like Protein n=1 Tax=Tribolium castaneum TaxID=7070 RepID=D6WYR2_TRICA|nr:PREDICTED: ankyrin repeat domain-containing protein 16 [Tribolium castaneum]EFA08450.1 Ankyrin repeat and KH domain-containing protein mask-like Protein [Tribolium castaneum]|eukprot:XP_968149.1 PREDICTED: ankyrin repeat domain-containing protein 16 [Tribolium castaneum]
MSLTQRQIAKILKQAQSGDLAPISALKTHWSVLKYQDTGDTILHCATRLGHLETVQYLLSFEPPGVDCTNNDNKTALHEAAQFSQPEIMKLLLDKGAQVNALKRADWTPLMLACTKTCLETVRVLVESGALINYRNKDGWTCMHLAARGGCGAMFTFLVTKGGDCALRTKNGRTVLHIAALHGSFEIVKILLKLGVLPIDVRDNCGNTALHEAVLGRHKNICSLLIQNGADIKCTNNVDFNLLFLASSEGYVDLAEYIILELGFDINITNSNGFTALHCAARKQQKDMCQYLVKMGANRGAKDHFRRVAFDYLTT